MTQNQTHEVGLFVLRFPQAYFSKERFWFGVKRRTFTFLSIQIMRCVGLRMLFTMCAGTYRLMWGFVSENGEWEGSLMTFHLNL